MACHKRNTAVVDDFCGSSWVDIEGGEMMVHCCWYFLLELVKFKTITKIKNKQARLAVRCCGHMTHLYHVTQIQQNEKCCWTWHFFQKCNNKPFCCVMITSLRHHFQLRMIFACFSCIHGSICKHNVENFAVSYVLVFLWCPKNK